MQKQLEEKIKMNEEEYARNLAEYKTTVEKIVSIKNSIEEIFNLVDNDVSRKYKEVSKSCLLYTSDAADE